MDRTSSKAAARARLAKAGSFALFIARAGGVLNAVAAAIAVVLETLYLIAPARFIVWDDGFAAAYPVGDGWFSITGRFLDYQIGLARWGADGETLLLNPPSVILAGLVQAAIAVLTVLMFHEVARMCVDLRRWVRESDGSTPFAPGVALRLNRIGAYLIATPVVGLVGYVALAAMANRSMGNGMLLTFVYLLLGILAILLSRVFDYGAALQEDVDGLL